MQQKNPVADTRFEYVEDMDTVNWPSTVTSLSTLKPQISDAFIAKNETLPTYSITDMKPWAANYYRISPNIALPPRMVEVSFSSTSSMDPLIQIILLSATNDIIDIHRCDKSTYLKVVNFGSVKSMIVIVGSRTSPGDYSLTFREVANASDTMITRWNTIEGKEYEIDPHTGGWHYVSPDIMVDNDGDGLSDGVVYFNRDNDLKVRLRNKGNSTAQNIQVDFWYQKAAPGLESSEWIPVQDIRGLTQQITGQQLLPGDVKWFGVKWAPLDDGTHHEHWCVKVKVTVPDEINTDNKMILSNFGRVILNPDGNGVLRVIWRKRRHAWWSILPGYLEIPQELGRTSDIEMKYSLIEELPPVTKTAPVLLKIARPQNAKAREVIKESLPPGVKGENLITLIEFVGNRAIGGVSIEV